MLVLFEGCACFRLQWYSSYSCWCYKHSCTWSAGIKQLLRFVPWQNIRLQYEGQFFACWYKSFKAVKYHAVCVTIYICFMLLHVEYQSQHTNTNKKLVFIPCDILNFKHLALWWCDFRIQISSCHIVTVKNAPILRFCKKCSVVLSDLTFTFNLSYRTGWCG